MKKKTSAKKLSELLNISPARSMEAIIKADLIAHLTRVMEKSGITHLTLAKKSGLSRSTITGILSGSLQKITIDRVLKIAEALGLVAEIKLKKSA